MRSPVVFTVIMMSGMLLASALLSFQLDKIYAQSTDPNSPPEQVTFDISASDSCDFSPDSIDCAPSDGATTTLNPPFDSNFDLACDTFGTPASGISATCLLDFRSPELNGDDWEARVSCSDVEIVEFAISITGCSGTLDDENHS
jgi:hypothetical protein